MDEQRKCSCDASECTHDDVCSACGGTCDQAGEEESDEETVDMGGSDE